MKLRNPDDEIEYTENLFRGAIKRLKKDGNKKYDFILKAFDDLKEALNKLYEDVWTNEKKPEQWRITKIIKIYKGKVLKNELTNQRNIYTKNKIPKLFGNIVTTLAKLKIIESMTKFQIGTRWGHQAQKHLFVLKSIMTIYSFLGISIILQLYDISKFFEMPWIYCVTEEPEENYIHNCESEKSDF